MENISSPPHQLANIKVRKGKNQRTKLQVKIDHLGRLGGREYHKPFFSSKRIGIPSLQGAHMFKIIVPWLIL